MIFTPLATLQLTCPSPSFRWAAFALFVLMSSHGASAAPYKPQSADEVLAHLPTRFGQSEPGVEHRLKARLAANPRDASAAAELAEHHYRIAQRLGDPRHIGYAQAILSRWQHEPAPPNEIRLVRALLAQFLHDFRAARSELDIVLASKPENLDALAYRAILNVVSANYDAARRDCNAMTALAKGLFIESCRPTVDALTGRGEKSYQELLAIQRRFPAAPPNERLWVETRLGEIAQRLGWKTQAEFHYSNALKVGIVDQYLLATFAEFLLDDNRPAQVMSLLSPHQSNDVLLLRLAIAARAAKHMDAERYAKDIHERMQGNRLRGDKTHLADEAWHELVFGNNASRALALATENWNMEQREPSDAKILIESAIAAKSPQGVAPVRRWLTESGLEDQRLRQLLSHDDLKSASR